METPFTTEQFLQVFQNYNEAVFPMQVIFYVMAISTIYLALKPKNYSGKTISGILFFFWLWMGVVYHLVFFTVINKAAYLFGILFTIQSFLFLALGIFQNRLSFSFRTDLYGITGISLTVFSLVIYPVLGYINQHMYPRSPTFGLPCPTTIFTLGMLLMTQKRLGVVMIIIPFLWSVIGFTAAIKFGVTEDTGLLIAGLLSLTLLLIRNRKIGVTNSVHVLRS